MKKFFYVLFFVISIFTFASDENGLGIVEDSDLRAAGVKVENIKKAKDLMKQVSSNYELRLLERKQLELQINKYILDNPEKYLKKIDELFDRIGAIEATIMKERLRSQIQMKKLVTSHIFKNNNIEFRVYSFSHFFTFLKFSDIKDNFNIFLLTMQVKIK